MFFFNIWFKCTYIHHSQVFWVRVLKLSSSEKPHIFLMLCVRVPPRFSPRDPEEGRVYFHIFRPLLRGRNGHNRYSLPAITTALTARPVSSLRERAARAVKNPMDITTTAVAAPRLVP